MLAPLHFGTTRCRTSMVSCDAGDAGAVTEPDADDAYHAWYCHSTDANSTTWPPQKGAFCVQLTTVLSGVMCRMMRQSVHGLAVRCNRARLPLSIVMCQKPELNNSHFLRSARRGGVWLKCVVEGLPRRAGDASNQREPIGGSADSHRRHPARRAKVMHWGFPGRRHHGTLSLFPRVLPHAHPREWACASISRRRARHA